MKATTPLTRGILAKQAGVNLETIRFYESKGLLPKPGRSNAGYRLYSPDQIPRLAFIKRGQELGFTLVEIKELLSLRASPARSNHRVKRLAEKKIAAIAAKIRDLKRMHRTLTQITQACDGCGTTEECPILQALEEPEPKRPTQRKSRP